METSSRYARHYQRLSVGVRDAAAPLLFLAGWRIVSLLIAIVASQFSPIGPPAGPGEVLARSLDHWDAGWYLSIARDGYALGQGGESGRENIAFYPLLPLLIKITHIVVPSWRLSGMLVTHLALIGAVLYLAALARLDYDRPTALRAVVALLLYPTAIFLTAIYTESLLLLALLGATYHARRGQWWLAALWGAGAGLTKTIGVIALIPLLWEYWHVRAWRIGGWYRRLGHGLAMALVPLGAAAYLLYLRLRFGAYQVYFDTQVAWYRHGRFQPFLTDGWTFLNAFLHGQEATVVNYFYPQGGTTIPSTGAFMLLDLLFLLAAIGVGIGITFRMRVSYGLLVLVGALLTAYSGSPQSLNRYTLVLFPLPLAFAVVGRRPVLGFFLLVCSGLLSLYHAYLFINGYWAG